MKAIRKYAAPTAVSEGLSILEIGGADSCFLDRILAEFNCHSYAVADTNSYGLSLLEKRLSPGGPVRLHRQSVLDLSLEVQVDVVFSVGLVEHFDVATTRQSVLAHFDVLKPGGIVIITFPTPTLLYRITRGLLEALGMWKFPDERPLQPTEVIATIRERAEILDTKTLWPLILTQYLIVARK